MKSRSAKYNRLDRGMRGFTLIELMIVITIILILIGMAAARYDRAVLRAQEAVLHHNLRVLRETIESYTLDKQAAPEALEDLQHAGYLRSVPTDPITRQKDWVTRFDDVALVSESATSSGIADVHSNSPRVSALERTAYNTW
jgi:general secretion pathway protein G